MMDLLKPITQLKAFTDLKTRVESKECCAVFGVDRQKPYFIAELVQQTQRRYFIVTPDDNTAKTVNDILNACAVNSNCFRQKIIISEILNPCPDLMKMQDWTLFLIFEKRIFQQLLSLLRRCAHW